MSWWTDFVAEFLRIARLTANKPKVDADWETVGPPDDETPPVRTIEVLDANNGNHPADPVKPTWDPSTDWVNGWWAHAARNPAHGGRIGATIVPRAVVVHTTDTLDGFGAIVKAWTTKPGKGNAAHFIIGRTSADGVVQFAPITKNANHAGGRIHGNWKTHTGHLVHPNTVSVGIEVVGGGRLRVDKIGQCYHPDTGKFVKPEDVYWDEKGRCWHRTTAYQLEMLRALLVALRPCLKTMPANWTVAPSAPYFTNGASWAIVERKPLDIVAHATLTPDNKTDCGPQILRAIKEWNP